MNVRLAPPRVWLLAVSLAGLAAPGALRGQTPPDSLLPVADVRVTPDSAAVESGDTVRFTATAYDSSGAPMPGVKLFWGASPSSLIGEIDSTGTFVGDQPMEGLVLVRPVNAAALGRARIVVTPPPLVEIRIEGPQHLVTGSYVPVRAVGTDRAGNSSTAEDARWSSSGPAVATVENGYLTAHAPGRVTLMAEKEGARGTLAVRVLPNRATALEIVCATCAGAFPVPAGASAGPSGAGPGGAGVVGAGTAAATAGGGEAGEGRALEATGGAASGSEAEGSAADLTILVGEAIQLEARALGGSRRVGRRRGTTGSAATDAGEPSSAAEAAGEPAAARWWLDGEGGLLDQNGNFVAQRPGRFVVMAQFGRLTARHVVDAYPRPGFGIFRVVGRGPVAGPRMSDLWVFQGVDGRDYAYTGSIGGDQVKVWDVTDPANPVQTDSLVVDARVINDVNLNQTGRIGVLTREGASNRRNGIVLFDASDPAHPKVISEYTETVTSGVHNAFFYADHIFCTNDGTRALHVISAKDPLHPVEVARWEIRPGQTNKYLHDVIVQDGLAYLSYWDDGLVILDVGNGVQGGSPENPVFVSRIAYPTGHTHTAWRWKNYVFTGDEIFGGPPVTPEGGVPAGFLHVIDVSDLEHPVEVAWYEVPGAGAHNIWMDEEREILYLSYYNAGVRALDVSGRLMGDLKQQGRELAYFLTGEPDPTRAAKPNSPMSWGPQLYKGNVFAADMNSGLWVLRYEPLGVADSSGP